MNTNRDFYTATLRVIDYMAESATGEIPRAKLQELAGAYWRDVADFLKGHRVGCLISGGTFWVNHPGNLERAKIDCNHSLSVIEEEASDRQLDRRAQRSGMRFDLLGFITGTLGLILSIISLLYK